MKIFYQNNISHNIHTPCNCHKQKRTSGISAAPQHSADGIISADKNHTAGADLHILSGQFIGLLRCLKSCQNPRAKQKQQNRKHCSCPCKETKTGANGFLHLLRPFLSCIISNQNRTSESQACNQTGNNLRHLCARRNSRHRIPSAVPANHHQIRCSVKCLYQICQQKRNGKNHYGFYQTPLC